MTEAGHRSRATTHLDRPQTGQYIILMYSPPNPNAYNQTVWAIVRQIPRGQVSTYGQIASMIPPPPAVDELQYRRLGARWVGSAMHTLPSGSDVPWQRVINSKGQISARTRNEGHREQRILLEAENVSFDNEGNEGRVDFALVGWQGPEPDWLSQHGLRPPKTLTKPATKKSDAQQPRLL